MDESTRPKNSSLLWSWEDLPNAHGAEPSGPEDSEPHHGHDNPDRTDESDNSQNQGGHTADMRPEEPDTSRHKPRTCRICLEDVLPTYDDPGLTTQFLGSKPRIRYVSEDPELGRLMRPCKCKGTQKYVHEGCLRAWRTASTAQRNMFECPTCKFQYHLQRLTWGKWASSKLVRAALTLSILFLSVFLLGFVADPILRLGSFDPVTFLLDFTTGMFDEFDYEDLADWIPDEQPNTWSWHFTKGFTALGVMGLFRSIFALRPWHWWNVRIGGGARRGRGRDRLDNINMVMILVGVFTFMMVSS